MFIIKNKIRRKFIMKNKNMLIFVISALLCLPIFLFADTETEPNDAWDATGVLEVENGVHDGEINPGSDEDYWAFQASEGDFVEVSTVGLTTLDTKLWIYDTDGVTELEYNDDFGGLQSYVSHTMDEDGTYYFRVGSWSNNTGAYGVELSGANLPVHYDNDLQARWVTGDANPVEGVESELIFHGLLQPQVKPMFMAMLILLLMNILIIIQHLISLLTFRRIMTS
jgi:hypothetical protein